jgi:SdpC family antimicrobial peptide
VLGAAFATGTGADAAEPGTATASSHRYTGAELIEGVVFLQGGLGKSLIDNGALGDISAAEKSHVEELLADPDAQELAADSARQILGERPDLGNALATALDDRDPVATSAALKAIIGEVAHTSAGRAASAGARSYVPGEVGPDCLFNVAVGGYLVIAVAAVGIGVVAVASVALVGDVVVAGKNAGGKRSGAGSDTDGQFVAALLHSV